MMNLNDGQANYESAIQNLHQALANTEEGSEETKQAFSDFSEALAEVVSQETTNNISKIRNKRRDNEIMAKRTNRIELTNEEMEFFNEAVEKQTIDSLEHVFPTTIIETVMTDIAQEHPLISEIDSRYTEAAIKYVYADHVEATAYWDVIPADIRQILIGGFKTLDMTVAKLSGYIALPKGYFELGPEWLANYVVTYLREAIQTSLENAIVNGDGNIKPLGMMRQLHGAIDGVYPEKPTVQLTGLTPHDFAPARSLLAKEKMLNGNIAFIVNPVTYETKVNNKLFFQNQQTGAWTKLPLPNGERVIQSYAVPEDRVILGNPKNYLLAVAGDYRVDKYEETLAIEDMDLYIGKLFANGIPKNPNAFVVLDLTTMEAVQVPESQPESEYQAQNTIDPVNPNESHALDKDGNANVQSDVPGA